MSNAEATADLSKNDQGPHRSRLKEKKRCHGGTQCASKLELLETWRHGLVLVCFARLAHAPSPSVLADAAPSALLALAPSPIVLADAPPSALAAQAPSPIVLANAPPSALSAYLSLIHI